jgi:hypothetical protein
LIFQAWKVYEALLPPCALQDLRARRERCYT